MTVHQKPTDQKHKTLGIIGYGAFGRFAAQHLAPYFEIRAYDAVRSAQDWPAQLVSLKEAASTDIVVLAMPVQYLSEIVLAITPYLREGALVLDVCSVKKRPMELLARLPAHVDILGTHPLFGPQSGKSGIAGLPIALVPLRGSKLHQVKAFLKDKLGLVVHVTTADDHDQEMAYIQGLTHLFAKVMLSLPKKELRLKTTAYRHLELMVDMLRYDSDDLFRAICCDNPHVSDVVEAFFTSVEDVSLRLGGAKSRDWQDDDQSHIGGTVLTCQSRFQPQNNSINKGFKSWVER
ncbi:prephenate dehydrogenase [Labrenzia sp. EL_126]|nr:prephenate dehydrogenase [Labrenzia sp. EL_126]